MVEQRRDAGDFVKVLDFGIAKIMDSDMPGLTRNDVVCGTPQYMAPEQATGSALDPRCDLYAVGVILYQMVTGHLPFDGQNSMEVLTKHVNEPPVPPRQRQPDAPISEAMESLILKALEKDPGRRPQSAEEFRQMILEVPSGKPVLLEARDALATPSHGTTLPTGTPSSASETALLSSPARASRVLPVAVGAAAVVAIAIAAAFGMRRSPAPAAAGQAAAGQAAGAASAAPGGAVSAKQPPAPKIARDPDKARDLVARAKELQASGDTGAARDILEQSLQLDPDNAEAHYRLGNLFLNTQPDRAKAEYLAAKRLDGAKYGDIVDMVLKGL
jgi:hypothetical protein